MIFVGIDCLSLFQPGKLDPSKRRRTFSGNYKDMHGGKTRPKSVNENIKELSTNGDNSATNGDDTATNGDDPATNGDNTLDSDLASLCRDNIKPRLSINRLRRASDVMVKVRHLDQTC